jgi:hypothetical protein
MKPAALGIRMHSGWGVIVAISHIAGKLDVVERTRIVVVDPHAPGAEQPYHFAQTLELTKAEEFLAEHAAATERMAIAAVEQFIAELGSRKYKVVGAAIVQGAGRALPALAKVLASHPLIHTAEGECFREAVRKACGVLQVPVIGVRARDLEEKLRKVTGADSPQLQAEIAAAGRGLGPPWTQDHKTAAAAALLALKLRNSNSSSKQAGARLKAAQGIS